MSATNDGPGGGVAPLPDRLSARRLLSRSQAVVLATAVLAVAVLLASHATMGFGPTFMWWGQAAIGAVTIVYVAVIAFKMVVIFGGGRASVIRFVPDDLLAIGDADLPTYTILVPLYREGKVIHELLSRLAALDYPADRVQVLLLIEADDEDTRRALASVQLDAPFEVVLIPPDGPRTKPKACNVGMARARGEFCVIYDAEDRPDVDQLRKAVLGFRLQPDRVVCIQAELQYWNPWTNWLTRCFAAEYAANFSLALRGLDRHHLADPARWHVEPLPH